MSSISVPTGDVVHGPVTHAAPQLYGRPPKSGSQADSLSFHLVYDDIATPMRDGCELIGDLYIPSVSNTLDTSRRWPCVLIRTPYNKDKINPDLRNPGVYWTQNGYCCFIQDCRGRFKSSGTFYKYTGEAQDGYDTVEWLAAQSWCNGSIVTDGPSYLCHVQTSMALLRPPHLKAMMCNKGGFWNAHTSGVRQGGAYEARQWVWGVKNASRKEHTMREALEHIEKTFDGWMRRYPFVRGSSPLSITPEYENYIFDQAEQSDYNEYWKQIGLNTEEYVDQFADIPALFLSGWYDIYARSTIDFFTHLQPRKKGPVLLIMGPWQHVGAEGHVAGEVDFGVNALVSGNLAPNMFSLSRRWFDRWVEPATAPQPRRMTAQEKLALAIQVAEEQQHKKERGGDGPMMGEESVSAGGGGGGGSSGSGGLERGSSGASPSHAFNNRLSSGGSGSGAASPSSLMVTTHPRGPYTSLSHISGSSPSHSPPPLPLTSGPSLYIPPSMAPRQHVEPSQPLPPPVRYFRMGGGDGHKTSQGNMFHGGVWMQAATWPPAATRYVNYFLTRRGLETRVGEGEEQKDGGGGSGVEKAAVGGGPIGSSRRSGAGGGGTRSSGGERRGEGAVERGRIGDKREAWTVDRADGDTTPHDNQTNTSSSPSPSNSNSASTDGGLSLPSPTPLSHSNSTSSLSASLATLSLTSQPFTPAFPSPDILHRLDHSTTFPYDPRNPCPTIGGNLFGYRNILVAGAYDQHERADMFLCSPPYLPLSSRRDVIVFRTAPLQQRLDITGTCVCVLYVSSTAVDTDFTVKLIDEYPPSMDYPHGFAMQVTHGIQRMKYRESREKATLMEPGKVYRVEVTMYPTSNLFSKGHCLRLDISSSNFPHFDVNMNTADEFESRRYVIAENTVYHTAAFPSALVLPVQTRTGHHPTLPMDEVSSGLA